VALKDLLVFLRETPTNLVHYCIKTHIIMVRSRRKDPKQESVVSQKDEVNDRISKTISILIETKRALNGKSAPSIGVNDSTKITEELPNEVAHAAGLAQRSIEDIVSRIMRIQNDQAEHASEYRDRISKRTQALESFDIEKTASNPLTRFWAHISAPFGSETGRWKRLKMLRALADIKSELSEVEDLILSSDPAILEGLYKAKNIHAESRALFYDELHRFIKDTVEKLEESSKRLEKMVKAKKIQDAQDKNKIRKDEESGGDGKREFTTPNIVEMIEDKSDKAGEDSKGADEPKPEPEARPRKSVQIPPDPTDDPPHIKEISDDPPHIKVKQYMQKNRKDLSEKVGPLIAEINKNLGDNGELDDRGKIPDPWGSFLDSVGSDAFKEEVAFVDEVKQSNKISYIPSLLRDKYTYMIGKLSLYINLLERLNKEIEDVDKEHRGNDIAEAARLKEHIYEYAVDAANEELREYESKVGYERPDVNTANDQEIVAFASLPITRWFKRFLTSLGPGGGRKVRLEVDKAIRDAKVKTNNVMNILEKRNLNMRSLANVCKEHSLAMANMYRSLGYAVKQYNNDMRVLKSEKKMTSDKFMHELIPETYVRDMDRIEGWYKAFADKVEITENLESKIGRLTGLLGPQDNLGNFNNLFGSEEYEQAFGTKREA
jgi:hypothetical protein